MTTLSDYLDLELAYRRVKADLSEDRGFVFNSFEFELAEIDIDLWFESILDEIEQGMFNPNASNVVEIPKAGGLIRPGCYLCLKDCLIYTALAQAILPKANDLLAWSQRTVEYSYILSGKAKSPKWFQNRFGGWTDFRERSLEKIDNGFSHVVITDISGFYDNISIRLLISDLAQLEIPSEIQNLISTCLNRWANVPSRGIPQGYSPSDLLAKIYINSIDENLHNLGYDHFRYVDDFRVFCRNQNIAKKAIVELSRLLRSRGLNLQTAKTKILPANEAKIYIEGVAPIINRVGKRFLAEFMSDLKSISPYISITQAERIIAKNPKAAPIEVIKETYLNHIINADDNNFDSTLFHFLIRRLANQCDDFALDHTKQLLFEHPEETKEVVNYWSHLENKHELETFLTDFLGSSEAIYDYQSYLLSYWILINFENVGSALLSVFRAKSSNENLPKYLLGTCRMILGKFGTNADLEFLRNLYPNVHGPLQKAEIIYSLRRLETGLRNEFLGRVQGDGDFQDRAAKLVKINS